MLKASVHEEQCRSSGASSPLIWLTPAIATPLTSVCTLESPTPLAMDNAMTLSWVSFSLPTWALVTISAVTISTQFQNCSRIYYPGKLVLEDPDHIETNALTMKSQSGSIRWRREGNLLYVKWNKASKVSMCGCQHLSKTFILMCKCITYDIVRAKASCYVWDSEVAKQTSWSFIVLGCFNSVVHYIHSMLLCWTNPWHVAS